MGLKVGDSDVKSLRYRDKDVSGSQMLESGTGVYVGPFTDKIHLLSSSKKWENIEGLHVRIMSNANTEVLAKDYELADLKIKQTLTKPSSTAVSTLEIITVDGEYFLKATTTAGAYSLEISVL